MGPYAPSTTTDSAQGASQKPIVLRHISTEFPDGKEVTSLDWNPSGFLLATGSSDSCARIWTERGYFACSCLHSSLIYSSR